jgi:hypothetical protein
LSLLPGVYILSPMSAILSPGCRLLLLVSLLSLLSLVADVDALLT